MHPTRLSTARGRTSPESGSRQANRLLPRPRVLRVELLEDRRLLSAGDTLSTAAWAVGDHPEHAPAPANNELKTEAVGRFLAAENALRADSDSLADFDPATRSSDPVSPTGLEQYLLELINRGRANPSAEAARCGVDLNDGLAAGTISTDPKPPLAFSPELIAAARGHSQWMLDTNTFSHTGVDGCSPGDRMEAAGYVFVPPWRCGENIAWKGSTGSVDATSFTADIHENLYRSPGHRVNQMNEHFREIGTGVLEGPFTPRGGTYQTVMVTENFALSGSGQFLTGVVFDDELVLQDEFYTPGEGLGGVQIEAVDMSSEAVFSATTWPSGGYSLALPEGSYTVTATGAALEGAIVREIVAIGSHNVKVDVMLPLSAEVPGAQVAQVLVRGSDWHADVLDHLDSAGLGHPSLPRMGYRLVGQEDPLTSLPWANLDTVSVTFNADVNISAEDLGIWGVDVPHYAVATDEFAYDPATFTATWTLAEPLEADKLLLVVFDTVTNTEGIPLDGEWRDGVSTVSGDGTPGGDFQFRFNVLPGDATSSGNVVASDVSMLASAFGSFATGSDGRYSPFVDFDASGNVVAADVSILASHFGQFLPTDDPVVPQGEGTAATATAGMTAVSEAPARATAIVPVSSDHARAPNAGLVPPGQGVSGRNPTTPADVNGDGHVSPIDALLVIRYLNDPASDWPSALPDTSMFYFDVNGDGTVSPIDALRVIAHLNSARSGPVDGEGEATASFQLVSDQRAAVPPVGGTHQALAAVPPATVSVADARSIDFSPQDKVHGDMAERDFSTVGDDASLEHDNIEMSALLVGDHGHSLRRMPASIPINPARERTRRESKIAVDRYFEHLQDADEASFLDGDLLNELVSRKGS